MMPAALASAVEQTRVPSHSLIHSLPPPSFSLKYDPTVIEKHRLSGKCYDVPDIDYVEEDNVDDETTVSSPIGAKQVPSAGKAMVSPTRARIISLFSTLSGQKQLDDESLKPVLDKTRNLLMSKNVASDVATTLCESLRASLVGQTVGSFQTVARLVREALEASLTKILTPRQSVDLLRDINLAKEAHRPYTIVFCGVNGVGKSTNLSKVCFWLLQNRLRVLIAACDTFRSGAVEQLRVHVSNLKRLEVDAGEMAVVDLYEKGYGKDASTIARDAFLHARQQGFDVVLVDTAGRMQDNEPLMRSLAKLVHLNQPDKVFFVGEALVGNDAVDQVVKFNQALRDFSETQQVRQIDGILLTKFDTIDEKVGAAVSMASVTGQAIYFVGTGQTYTDLKKLNVKAVVQSLLK
jgi:signal recognition particle receptor subunit alpha